MGSTRLRRWASTLAAAEAEGRPHQHLRRHLHPPLRQHPPLHPRPHPPQHPRATEFGLLATSVRFRRIMGDLTRLATEIGAACRPHLKC